MHDSLIAHGGLTERSLTTPIGKGREGKGREVGHFSFPNPVARRTAMKK